MGRKGTLKVQRQRANTSEIPLRGESYAYRVELPPVCIPGYGTVMTTPSSSSSASSSAAATPPFSLVPADAMFSPQAATPQHLEWSWSKMEIGGHRTSKVSGVDEMTHGISTLKEKGVSEAVNTWRAHERSKTPLHVPYVVSVPQRATTNYLLLKSGVGECTRSFSSNLPGDPPLKASPTMFKSPTTYPALSTPASPPDFIRMNAQAVGRGAVTCHTMAIDRTSNTINQKPRTRSKSAPHSIPDIVFGKPSM